MFSRDELRILWRLVKREYTRTRKSLDNPSRQEKFARLLSRYPEIQNSDVQRLLKLNDVMKKIEEELGRENGFGD